MTRFLDVGERTSREVVLKAAPLCAMFEDLYVLREHADHFNIAFIPLAAMG